MKKFCLHSRISLSAKQVFYIVLFGESLVAFWAIFSATKAGVSPFTHFREKGFVTTISWLQLLLAGIISGSIQRLAKHSANIHLHRSSSLWMVIVGGWIFLALDESLSIHEQIDSLAHDWLQIEETNLTDLADDLAIAVYLVIFLVYLLRKRQIIGLFRPSFPYFGLGFGLTVAMIVLDIISNNDLFLSLVFARSSTIGIVQQWLSTLEETVKIFAEGMFIVGIYQCWRIAKSLKN